jgi:hypothetical protein
MGLGINATLFSLTDQSGSQNLFPIAKDPPGNVFIKKMGFLLRLFHQA